MIKYLVLYCIVRELLKVLMSNYFNINSLIKYTGYPTKLSDNITFV